MTVACAICHASNRDRAMFCGSCAHRLETFAPNGTSMLSTFDAPAWKHLRKHGVLPPGPAPRPIDTGRRRRRLHGFAGAMLVASGTVMATLWNDPPAAPAASRAAARDREAPVEAPRAGGERSVPPAVPPPTAPSIALPVPDVPRVVGVPRPHGKSAGTAVERNAPSAAPVRPSPATPGTRSTSVEASRAPADAPDDPRVGCEHLFFAFAARCEANHCSTARYARHPHCDAVRADGRKDDARRDQVSN